MDLERDSNATPVTGSSNSLEAAATALTCAGTNVIVDGGSTGAGR